MPSSTTWVDRGTYHHGDLRAALLATATQLLEEGEPFSLRAVARGAGVSPTAPYRHFSDREALETAVAVDGFRRLAAVLDEPGAPTSTHDLGDLAVRYVEFALDHPAVFRLMFGQECDDSNDDRVVAAGQLRELLGGALAGVFPGVDPQTQRDLAVGSWALVHGLAFLHLDGKLPAHPRAEVSARVRAALAAVLAAEPTGSVD